MLYLLVIAVFVSVCLLCFDGGIPSHDQREKKKQLPYWQCGGSVWWEWCDIMCIHVTLCARDHTPWWLWFFKWFPLLYLASVTLFNCSVGRSDCSRCRTADPKYGCVWCGGASSSRCVYQDSCTDEIKPTCPAPVIHFVRHFYAHQGGHVFIGVHYFKWNDTLY